MSDAITKLKSYSFRKFVKNEQSGAQVIGFVSLTLVVGQHEFTFSDLKVRVNVAGEHHLIAPGRKYKNSEGEWRTASAYKFDDATYAALRKFVYAREEILAACVEANTHAALDMNAA